MAKRLYRKNHEYIRYVLPKGTSFDELNQEKANVLASNINSTSRDSLNGKTPYVAVQILMNEDVIKKFGITNISPDKVSLSPSLLKEGND